LMLNQRDATVESRHAPVALRLMRRATRPSARVRGCPDRDQVATGYGRASSRRLPGGSPRFAVPLMENVLGLMRPSAGPGNLVRWLAGTAR
jgi:hypothetical protein